MRLESTKYLFCSSCQIPKYYMADYLQILEETRKKNPLVLQITNSVTVNDCANMTVCFGASPIMSEDANDSAELAAVADALVLNIGTINEFQMEVMKSAASVAEKRKIPIILDPVGAGASTVRNKIASQLMNEYAISVIKGNPGEILSLSGEKGKVRGVDSMSTDATSAAFSLAKNQGITVVVSGKEDKITDGRRLISVENGTSLMGKLSGTGCMSAPCCAAASSIGSGLIEGCTLAMTVLGIAGEIAAAQSFGPGTFKPLFFDAVNNITPEIFQNYAKIREVV